jgi:hypothetical protein
MTHFACSSVSTPRGRRVAAGAAATMAACLLVLGGPAHAGAAPYKFEMIRSPGAVDAGCLPKAKAKVKIKQLGQVESMDVDASGLSPNTGYDFFVIQTPNAPFGLAWYQGDLETDAYGNGHVSFIGRFNEETFIVAPGSAPAPVRHDGDASSNPATAPVHTYHLGLWFNSPLDAAAAGCPGTTTPFNGDHDAGIQILNTANFENLTGPLLSVTP